MVISTRSLAWLGVVAVQARSDSVDLPGSQQQTNSLRQLQTDSAITSNYETTRAAERQLPVVTLDYWTVTKEGDPTKKICFAGLVENDDYALMVEVDGFQNATGKCWYGLDQERFQFYTTLNGKPSEASNLFDMILVRGGFEHWFPWDGRGYTTRGYTFGQWQAKFNNVIPSLVFLRPTGKDLSTPIKDAEIHFEGGPLRGVWKFSRDTSRGPQQSLMGTHADEQRLDSRTPSRERIPTDVAWSDRRHNQGEVAQPAAPPVKSGRGPLESLRDLLSGLLDVADAMLK